MFCKANLSSDYRHDASEWLQLISAGVVCQNGSKESAVEVRRVDVVHGLKLYDQLTYERFVFQGDLIKLIVHQSLSNNLYAFGNWVCRKCIHCNKL